MAVGGIQTVTNVLGLSVDAQKAVHGLSMMTGSAHNAGKATEHFERTTKNLTRSLGVLGGAFGIRQMVEYADTWTLINARIRLVTESQEQANTVHQRVFEIAQKTRNTLAATSVLYTRVALNADQLGVTHEELLQVVESVNAAMLVSGATGVEAAQAMRQFAQALGSGRVQGDEFRTMMEAMPLVARAVADEMGVAMGDLYKLSADGLIEVDTVISALLAKNEELMSRAESMPWTVGQSFEYMGAAFTRTIGILNMGLGVTTEMADGFKWLSDRMEYVVAVVGALTASMLTYRLGLLSASVGQTILTSAQTIRQFYLLARGIETAANASMSLRKGLLGVALAVAVSVAGVVAFRKIIEAFDEAENNFLSDEELDKLIGQFENFVRTSAEVEEAIRALRREANRELFSSGLDEQFREFGFDVPDMEMIEIQWDVADKIREAREEFEELEDVTEEHWTMWEAAIRNWGEVRMQAVEYTREVEAALEKWQEQERLLDRFANNLQRGLADAFERAFDDGLRSFRDFGKAMKAMFIRLLSDMAAAVVSASVMDPLKQSLRGLLFPDAEQEMKDLIERMQEVSRNETVSALAKNGKFPTVEVMPAEELQRRQFEGKEPFLQDEIKAEVTNGQDIAKMMGSAISGVLIGTVVGSATDNAGLGALGGGVGGALAGYMQAGPIGALIGGVSGAVSGFISALGNEARERERQRELQKEHNRLLSMNNLRLNELRDEFTGNANRLLKEAMNTRGFRLWLQRIEGAGPEGRVALPKGDFEGILKRLADELNIELFDAAGNLIPGASQDLYEAIQLTVKGLTEFKRTMDDLLSRQQAFNKLFDIDDSPRQGLEDTYSLLTQLAPDLMQMLGLTNLNLDSEEARATLLAGLREIFEMIDAGEMTLELLGAFEDKNALLDAILRVKDALDEFHSQLIDVTTDFPRAMDIAYYEQLYGKYGTGETGAPPRSDPGGGVVPPGIGQMTPTAHSTTWRVSEINIISTGDESGEELLQKIEQAALSRKNRGGRVNLGLESEVF